MNKQILAPVLGMLLVTPEMALSKDKPEINNLELFTAYVSNLVEKQSRRELSSTDISRTSPDDLKKIMKDTGLCAIEIPSNITHEKQINIFEESAEVLGFINVPEERDDRYTYIDQKKIMTIDIDPYSSSSTCTYSSENVGFSDDNCDGTIESSFYKDDNGFYFQSPGFVRVGESFKNAQNIEIK